MIWFSVWEQAFCQSVVLIRTEWKKLLEFHIWTSSRFSQERSNILEKINCCINFCKTLIVLIYNLHFPEIWWLIELHLSFLTLLFHKAALSKLFPVFMTLHSNFNFCLKLKRKNKSMGSFSELTMSAFHICEGERQFVVLFLVLVFFVWN